MDAQFEETSDLSPEPGNCERDGDNPETGSVNALARGEISQEPEKEAQNGNLGKIRKNGQSEGRQGVEFSGDCRNSQVNREIHHDNELS
ncbi:MAG: hypothetical protein F2951_06180 [Actinobacteria bacterium]|nr:hypothetical protein [Actinomycetota bacterium]